MKLCDRFGINPLRLISSGSMVIIVPADKKDDMMAAMEAAGVSCSIIGAVKEESFGVKMSVDGVLEDIDPPYADEIYKVVG